MAGIQVFRNNNMIFTQAVKREFYIIEAPDGELFWYEDTIDYRPGVYKVTLQYADESPSIPFVLPDWQLVIDDTWMERRFYQDVEKFVDLKGRVIEFRFKDYRFVFHL